MEEQLSGACTVEIAAFNEFTAVLAAPHDTAEFDHAIFDTAPTGHTLRLLSLPSAWSGYVAEHPAGASCLGPLAGLDQQREQYANAVATLADPALTSLVLLSRAETSALREAARASTELAALGVANQRLLVNGLLRDPEDDSTALAFSTRQAVALAGASEQLTTLPVAGVDLVGGDVTGLAALRRLIGADAIPAAADADTVAVELPGLDELLDELDHAGNGVVMTMGKGGVGKTTLAAAVALALVDRGHDVTLSTTDPAAHITEALADAAPEGVLVQRIDPAAETARYTDVPAEVSELLARLRDPEFARMLVVTLAESTPVHEADRLQADLRRARMEPFGWVVNASLAMSETTRSTLRPRRGRAHAHRARAGPVCSENVADRLAGGGSGRRCRTAGTRDSGCSRPALMPVNVHPRTARRPFRRTRKRTP
jgi:arsenite-transporting ATPase